MKKLTAVLILSVLAMAASATPLCTKWVGADGISRTRCDTTRLEKLTPPVMANKKVVEDVAVRRDSERDFTIINRTEQTFKYCHKDLVGSVHCWGG